MSGGQTMRRIVLPQAMRVIVPPTGNETIAMVKDTSLLIALPLSTELFYQLQSIGSRTYQIFPAFVAAILFYLIITQRPHGRPVLPRAALRPRLRPAIGVQRPRVARLLAGAQRSEH